MDNDWSELDVADRTLLLSGLLLQLRECRLEGQDALALLCPPGTGAEISALWERVVDCVVDAEHRESLRLPVTEYEGLLRPRLYTTVDRETSVLSEFFSARLAESGLDPSSLLPITPSLEALRGFYFASLFFPPCLTTPSTTSP